MPSQRCCDYHQRTRSRVSRSHSSFNIFVVPKSTVHPFNLEGSYRHLINTALRSPIGATVIYGHFLPMKLVTRTTTSQPSTRTSSSRLTISGASSLTTTTPPPRENRHKWVIVSSLRARVHNDIEFVINLVRIADTFAPTHDDDNDFVDTGLHNHTAADTLAATAGHFSSSSHQQEIPNLTTADTLAATATSTRRETTPPKTPPRKQVRFAPSAKKTSAASASPEHARRVRRSAQLQGGTANVDINIGNPTALALIDGNGITPGEESFDTDNMAAAANSADTLQAARLHGPLTETAVQRYHEQKLRELRSKSIRPLRTAQIGHVEPRDENDDDELYNPVMAMDSLRTRSAIATGKGYKMLSRDGIEHDDDELYNPVMTMDSLRTLSAIAAGKGYKMRQCDIPNAYLQGRLADQDGNPRYIYLHDPPTRKDVQGRKFYLKLLRPLHGLRQSGRLFCNELHGHLKDIGSTHPLSYINEFESSGTTSFVGPSSRYTWLPIGDHVRPPSHDTVARRTFRHDPTPHSSRPGRSSRHELLSRARDLPGPGEGRSTISPDDSPSPRGAITSPLSYNGRNKIKRLPANTELVASPNNPKRTGSASHARYENYKHATTVARYGVSSVLALVNISGSAAMSVMFSPVLSLSACYGVSSILADAREESLSAYYGVSFVLAGAREGSFEISYDPLLSVYHTDNDLRDTGDPQIAATCAHLLRADVMASRAPDHRVSLCSFDLDNLDGTPGPSHAGTTAGSTWNQFCAHCHFHLASTVCAVGVTMGMSATITDNIIGLLSVPLTSRTDLLHNLLNKLHVTADLQGTDARFARLGHVDEPGPDALDASMLYSKISRPCKGLLTHGNTHDQGRLPNPYTECVFVLVGTAASVKRPDPATFSRMLAHPHWATPGECRDKYLSGPPQPFDEYKVLHACTLKDVNADRAAVRREGKDRQVVVIPMCLVAKVDGIPRRELGTTYHGYFIDEIFINSYVDDIPGVGSSDLILKWLRDNLRERFTTNDKDTGDIRYILGTCVTQDLDKGLVSMNQTAAIPTLVERFNLHNSLASSNTRTPMSQEQLPRVEQTGRESKSFPYLSAIGSLLYISLLTRPDISYAVGVCARYGAAYGPPHVRAMNKIIEYPFVTRNYSIVFSHSSKLLNSSVRLHESGRPRVKDDDTLEKCINSSLETFCDADFAGDITRRSTSGNISFLYGSPLRWLSQLQKLYALSTAESGIYSAVEAVKDAALGVRLDKPIPVYEDNAACRIMTAQQLMSLNRAKHYITRLGFLQDQHGGTFEFIPCDTENKIADAFTKSLPADSFIKFHDTMVHNIADLQNNIGQTKREINKLTMRETQIRERLALHPAQVGRSTPSFSLHSPMNIGLNATRPPLRESAPTPPSCSSSDHDDHSSGSSTGHTRFARWAHLAALVDNLSHKTRTLCGHPKILGGTPPLINIDSLPDEVILPLYASLKNLMKLGMVIDAVLASSKKNMTAQDYQQYELATSTHAQVIVDNYQPGGLEIALQIMPTPVIRLFSLFKVIALKDIMPLSEEYFRDAITGAVVTTDKQGAPNWAVLLNVLHTNEKHMAELGASYDVFKTCSALLTIVKAIPRAIDTFGLTFINHIEGLELRMQTVPYHEATKSAQAPKAGLPSINSPRWHQGHLRKLIDVLRSDHVRVTTHNTEVRDDPIPLDKVDTDEPDVGNSSPKPPGLKFNLSECTWCQKDCPFDHRAFRKDDKKYIDKFLTARKTPISFDDKKMQTMTSKLGLDLAAYDCVEPNSVDTVPRTFKTTFEQQLLNKIASLHAKIDSLHANTTQGTPNNGTKTSDPTSSPTTTQTIPSPGNLAISDAEANINAPRLVGLSDEQSSKVALHGPNDRRLLIAKYLSGNSTEA